MIVVQTGAGFLLTDAKLAVTIAGEHISSPAVAKS